MQVTLIGKDTLCKVNLPRVPIGNYWLTDNTKEKPIKLINIEGKDGAWQIKTDGNVNIIRSDAIRITNSRISVKRGSGDDVFSERMILREYGMYAVRFRSWNNVYIIYCSPTYEDSTIHLNILNNKELYIGSGEKCEIRYRNVLVAETHARLYYANGKWAIDNYDKKMGTFVNNVRVTEDEKFLLNGDIIYIMGLKIVILGNSIFVNNPENLVTFSNKRFELCNEMQFYEQDEDIEEDEQEIELYNENDYFSRAPRIKRMIEVEKVNIDAPPQQQDQDDMPAILSLGSSISMGFMMLVSMTMTIDSMQNGTASMKRTIASIVMTIAMLIGMILFPILINRWQKRKKKRYEQKRQYKYREYLEKKKRKIETIKGRQKEILYENYVSVDECSEIIMRRSPRLWERKADDYDFLQIRLGIGDVPLKIELNTPNEQFALDDDDLLDVLHEIVDNSKMIHQAPVCTSLAENNISAIVVGDDEVYKKIMQSIIIQLIAFHSYEDLKIAFFIRKENEKYWEYVKMLPHVWNDSKKIRFFADTLTDMREVSSYLEQVFKERSQIGDDKTDYKNLTPYYLIITDDYKSIENLRIIDQILNSKKNLGFSLLCISRDLMQLPSECKNFVSLEQEKGIIFDNEIVENDQREIQLDSSYTIFFERLVQIISNIPIRYTTSKNLLLPENYTFLEMYDVGLIEQLNILERWEQHDSTLSLQAPIGADVSGIPILLDVHEKAHGPHGLIAGSTGSGKSEFIITYILSMAINYHPNDVVFLIIDYKGGGVAGAFEKDGMRLPHLIGTITNIDTNGLRRSLSSIQSELRRRQIVFNKARNMIDEGTIDIYKYQRLYHEGIVKEAIPHLIIICDEFAELKQQQPEFMEELISVSRIGRSLGVHLILATQKPAGIVNDQIRSNSKFSVCLKVQSREDSRDVIGVPDAAKLSAMGQFFMQVGGGDMFVLGKAAWTGAPYYPSNVIRKKIDNSIQFVSNVGVSMTNVDDIKQKAAINKGEQLTNIVKYIADIARKENIKTNNLWLDDIPADIYLNELKRKYNRTKVKRDIIATIGEYDDPLNQKQGLVNINFSQDGNVLIFGNAESGKETLISTIIYDLMTTYTTNDVWMYVLDFGTEALKIFKNSPHVGDVLFVSEYEKVDRFFDMIQKEIKKRKEILSNYNGDFNLYRKSCKIPIPTLIIFLNNYEAFSENYERYDDRLLAVTREGSKCGIVFVAVTSNYNDLRFRLKQNFRKRIALQLNNEDDYMGIFDKVGKKRPKAIFGRGLVTIENNEIYEFQTAKICLAEEYNEKINNKNIELHKMYEVEAPIILVMPDIITIDDVEKFIQGIEAVPIGLYKKDLRLCNYNFKNNFITPIISKNSSDVLDFIDILINELRKIPSIDIVIFDAEEMEMGKKSELLISVNEFATMVLAGNKDKHTICIIKGIDKFINEIQKDAQFLSLLKQAQITKKYSFIISDKTSKMKSHEYDAWYKYYIDGDSAIYVGNGVEEQYMISLNDRRKVINNCGRSFGYVIKHGDASLIKLVDMKEMNENE